MLVNVREDDVTELDKVDRVVVVLVRVRVRVRVRVDRVVVVLVEVGACVSLK